MNENEQGRGFSPKEWEQMCDLVETTTSKFANIAKESAYLGAKEALADHKRELCTPHLEKTKAIEQWLMMLYLNIGRRNIPISMSLVIVIILFIIFL